MSTQACVRFNFTNALANAVGAHGVHNSIPVQKSPRLSAAHSSVHKRVRTGELPFLRLHEDDTTWDEVQRIASSICSWCQDFVVLGIGGSSLGGRALIAALGGSGIRVHFPDNLDPEQFGDLLDSLDLSRTAFNVISKSGGTLETMVQFLVVRHGS